MPVHKKFVLYIINNGVLMKNQNEIIDKKIKELVNNEYQLYSACSFGFDYIALDSYYDITEDNYVMRISMNDSIVEENILKKIKEFINDNF